VITGPSRPAPRPGAGHRRPKAGQVGPEIWSGRPIRAGTAVP